MLVLDFTFHYLAGMEQLLDGFKLRLKWASYLVKDVLDGVVFMTLNVILFYDFIYY